MRLDLYLAKKYPDYSRSFLQKYVRDCGVFVNKKLIKKPHFELKEDDCVKFPRSLKSTIKKVDHSIASPALAKAKILLEKKSFVVIEKPPYISTEEISAGMFSVHRLDKNTSGALVLAKDIVTQAKLQKQWKDRLVKKEYVALIRGILPSAKGEIQAPIARSNKDRKKMAVSARKGARSSLTEYEVEETFGDKISLVRAYPLTGRTHQIRVHFASIGHPIIGDGVYGDSKLNNKFHQKYGLARQFLHAGKLTFKNPETDKKIEVNCPLSKDLDDVLRLLGKTVSP